MARRRKPCPPTCPGPEAHDRCGGHNRQGGPCRLHPVPGTEEPGVPGVCGRHGGKAPQVKAAADRRVAAAEAAAVVARLGLPRQVPAHQALIEEVWRTAGRVAWLDAVVTQHGDGGIFVSTAFGPKPSAWEDALRWERQHLAQVSVAAIRGGAIEAHVEIAKDMGQRVGAWLDAIVADLGLTAEQRRAAWVSGERHLHLVAGPADVAAG